MSCLILFEQERATVRDLRRGIDDLRRDCAEQVIVRLIGVLLVDFFFFLRSNKDVVTQRCREAHGSTARRATSNGARNLKAQGTGKKTQCFVFVWNHSYNKQTNRRIRKNSVLRHIEPREQMFWCRSS
jgi:hypothetical protein